jgi:DNA repair exonuclease SbcCD ATPase subunit
MFTKIKLHNFQNHRNLEISLSQITTIVGESDSGKSAIVRAFQWLCLNLLQGDSFISHGKKKCFVQLEVLDYGQIVRRKGSGINGYILKNDEERNAIGKEVPQDIANILNIGEINIAAQHSPIFWFTLTPGQLAKELNSIADIAWLDRIMQASGSNLRKVQAELDVTANRVMLLEKSVKETEWVETANIALKSLESQQNDLQKTKVQLAKLTDIINTIIQFQSELKTATEIIKDFSILPSKYNEAIQQQAALQRLTVLIDSYPNITESLPKEMDSLKQTFQKTYDQKTRYDDLINILDNAPNIQDPPDLSDLQKYFKQLSEIKTQYDKISNLISQHIEEIPDTATMVMLFEKCTVKQKQSDQLSNFIDQLTDITDQYNESKIQLQESEKYLHEQMGGVCPICGQSI